ncbi:hypothetical protein GDO78_021478 [Eleutherodactylus coqui]|uniref:Uncharacterized protein n=1 Tax=Eleutherodactylus coqui TaxID=57060 RepID=A0A8J6BAE4_ELECQ|nr:hypothetical protein GDO78_021478 [Eleutherodactylus coqui]
MEPISPPAVELLLCPLPGNILTYFCYNRVFEHSAPLIISLLDNSHSPWVFPQQSPPPCEPRPNQHSGVYRLLLYTLSGPLYQRPPCSSGWTSFSFSEPQQFIMASIRRYQRGRMCQEHLPHYYCTFTGLTGRGQRFMPLAPNSDFPSATEIWLHLTRRCFPAAQ